jgi:hypothetical protein
LKTHLRGTEALTLEVGASLSLSAARPLVPARFELDAEPRANVLLFKMTGLAARGLSFATFDYFEALWRVSILHEGAPAWFAVACDIDHPVVRALGARLVRYPTRAARIVGSEGRWLVEAGGAKLDLRVSDEDTAAVPALRRTFVARGANVYEIPWDEEPPAKARSARVTASDDSLLRATFGDAAKLDDTAVVHRGRVHMCGFARAV